MVSVSGTWMFGRTSSDGATRSTLASLAFSSLSGWRDRGLRGAFIDLTDAVWRVRGYGDFFSYCLVAEGAVDIAAEPEVSAWPTTSTRVGRPDLA